MSTMTWDYVAEAEYLIARCDLDLGHPVDPDDDLGRDHHDCPVWGLYAVVTGADGDWWPETVADGMRLPEAQNLAEELGCSLLS